MNISARIYVVVLCLIWALSSVSTFAAGSPELNGAWKGLLGTSANGLHLIFRLKKDADGYYGQLESVEQGAKLQVENATISNDKVHIDVKAVGGVFEGKLNKEGTAINGTWTQNGVPPQPLTLDKTTGSAGGSPAHTSQQSPISKPDPKPFLVPLLAQMTISPQSVQTHGKSYLVYELRFANIGRADCNIEKIEVLPDDSNSPIASFSGRTLEGMFRDRMDPEKPAACIPPDGNALAFLWVASDLPPEKLPKTLRHKIYVKVGTYPELLELTTLPGAVTKKETPVLGNPFPAGEWFAINGASNTSVHRRAVLPLDGKSYIGQRFAIDWIQKFPDGKTFQGDPEKNTSYKCYGKDLIAVADGTVVRTKDGISENVPGPKRAVPITLETLCGNHVVLDLGAGNFAFYAHMQPGTVQVKPGDRVKKGQVLGKLGNSGNSDEPHLHFHLCNGPSPVGSDGVPFFHTYDWNENGKKTSVTAMPLENEVVNFTDNK